MTTLAQYDYEYHFAGRIRAIDSLIDGRSEFSFNTTDQLTAADHDVHGSSSNHNPNEAYTYDANGNRIGSGFIVDAQNRTMSDGVYDYQYDAEGNRIRRTLIAEGSYAVNTFDHRHRLVRVDFYNASDVLQQSVTYAYDAFNRMVRRSVDDDGDGQADRDQYFAGFDGDNSTLEFYGPDVSDLAHRRLWGPFIDQLIASEEVDSLTTAGEVYWPVTDHTGTIRDVGRLDDVSGDFLIASHRVYSSFGLLTDEYDPATGTASGVDLDYGFTARFTDSLTGMTHHQFRWYDPQLGKWISEDPLGFAAGDINTTRYVANAPLSYTDPTGLIAVSIGDGNDSAAEGGSQDDKDLRYVQPPFRELTPGEIGMVLDVFQGHLDPDNVLIYNGRHNPFAGDNTLTPGTTIHFPPVSYRPDFFESDLEAHFVHELTHVLQTQQGGTNVLTAGGLWVRNFFNYRTSYKYNRSDLGRPLWTFTMEQQAEIIAHHYILNRDFPSHPLIPKYVETIGGFQTQLPKVRVHTWPGGYPQWGGVPINDP